MIKQHPFDDYNQTLHLFATTVGTLTPQWGNPAPRHGWKIMIEYE
ncbi:MAG: hypothetical protein PUI49_11140 [Prevotellaceae bacterium]|nr:hypothetical protein [Prevotellaceae bacterium]MDY5209941.1 hypothetical protein [Prevotella sp.]